MTFYGIRSATGRSCKRSTRADGFEFSSPRSAEWLLAALVFFPPSHALPKIYLTFQPLLFRAIKPIVRCSALSSSGEKLSFPSLICSQLIQMKRKILSRRPFGQCGRERGNSPPISLGFPLRFIHQEPHANPLLFMGVFNTRILKGPQMRNSDCLYAVKAG